MSQCIDLGLFIFTILYSTLGNEIQAPAEVTLKISISKIGNNLVLNESIMLRLCIDKINEKCYWTFNKEIGVKEFHKEFKYQFPVNNMNSDMAIGLKLEQRSLEINFARKKINLNQVDRSRNFEFHSIDLETIIKVKVIHRCEFGYYPPGQCTKFCYPVPGEHKCDDFGNIVCETGLFYDSKNERCLANNCAKSNIVCLNNGKCTNQGAGFKCICPSKYIGKFCGILNPCYENPCKNGGYCNVVNQDKNFQCLCRNGYHGNKCEEEAVKNEPITINNNDNVAVVNKPKNSTKKCLCPHFMKCKFSETGDLISCVAKTDEPYQKTMSIDDNQQNKVDTGKVVSKSNHSKQSWQNITLTTIIVVGIGCLMFILCIGISIMVFYQTRSPFSKKLRPHENSNFNQHSNCTPSTQYTQFSPLNGYKRADSMEQNSVYLLNGDQSLYVGPIISCGDGGTLATPPHHYSIRSNSYQESPHTLMTASYPAVATSSLNNFTTPPRTASVVSEESNAPSLPPRPEHIDS